jgi:alpha-tubulin suppressor-like RCC1 family protein
MGDNDYGQLGDNTFINTNFPEQIVASNVTAIAAGYHHSLFIKSDGSLWAMGNNDYGDLGDGSTLATNKPEQVVASNVIAVATGDEHSLFIKSDGSLWGMGENSNGQLGDGTWSNTNLPEQIVASGVIAVAAGAYHSLFLKNDGSLWAMGYNFDGELGNGIYSTNYNANPNLGINRPIQIVAGPPGYNKISGQLLSTGDIQLSFIGIAGANYAIDRSFTLAPPNWLPQSTNVPGLNGVLIFTNTPNQATNNFWRIRSVP